jgi:hypothetical protein
MNIENEIETYDIECEMNQRDEMNDTNGDHPRTDRGNTREDDER